MAITKTSRFALNRWDSGSDPFNRILADADNLQIETLGAIFRTGVDNTKGDASSASHVRSLFFATDTSTLYYSNGSNWVTLNNPGQAEDLSAVTTGTSASAGTSTTSGGVVNREFALANHVHPVGTPSAAVDIGTSSSAGTANGGIPAAHDHVHKLGSGSINTSALFGNNVVTSAALADTSVSTAKLIDSSVTAGKIASGAVTRSKLASGLDVLESFATTATRTSAIPSPVEGRFTYLQDRNVLSFYTGTEWLDVLAGQPLSGSNSVLDGGDAFSF